MYGDALVVRMGAGGEALVEAAVARGRGALGWTRRHLWVGVDRVAGVEPNFAGKASKQQYQGRCRPLCNCCFSATILKTNSTSNNNSWRPEVNRDGQLPDRGRDESPMRLPSARARTERRGNHPEHFLFALALCSVQFLKLPQD